MLVKLIPDQIAKFWDLIKYALENSPPLTTETHYDSWINEMLTSAMSGSITVWAIYSKEDKIKFEGLALTSFEVDRFIKKKSLLVYYVFSYTGITDSNWIDGIKSLAQYAKLHKCTRIVTYSSVPEVLKISKKLGGDTSITFISFNVGDLI